MTTAPPSIADLVAATPASRERYVDFLRAASILVVILGHWLMAVVTLEGSTLGVGNLIAEVRGMWVATWLFQVMPVFFFVGGFASLVTLDALSRRGAGYAEFANSRVRRLVRPVAFLLAVWLPLVTVVQALDLVDRRQLAQATVVVTQLLWFVGVYLIVVALAPPMLRLHRQFGERVLFALAAGCALVDLLRFAYHVPLIGFLNFGFVWLFAHQLGFFYADGSLRQLPRRTLLIGAASGLAALWLLTTVGPYPRSMVGLPGETTSNMNPPSLCLIALTVWQVALVMLARDAVSWWLRRPGPWGAVIAVNAVIMTILLWHLSALLIAVGGLLPLGFPQPDVGSRQWWLLRPVWIAILAGITFGFVRLFGRYERPPAESPGSATVGIGPLAALGTVLAIVGVCGFAVAGLVDFAMPNGRRLIVIPVSPLISLASLMAGVALVRVARRGAVA